MPTLAFNFQPFGLKAGLREESGQARRVDPVDVYGEFPLRTEPAPMGIADYGKDPNGAYAYNTTSFVGIVTIASLSTQDNSTGDPRMSFQLNVNLVFRTNAGLYVYWIQDMARIDTSSGYVSFLDNIWNSSASKANMSAISGVLIGSGQIRSSNFGSYSQSWYYDWANESSGLPRILPGNDINLTYPTTPTTITFNVTSWVSSSGKPMVSFAYDDGYGLITYDTVTFADVTGPTAFMGFEVDGFDYNPAGWFYDSELILGGYGGMASDNTTDLQSNVTLQLEYWNGNNYQIVPSAYNFGSDTGENIDNVLSEFSYYPGNGEIFAEILDGNGTLGELYDQSQTGTIDLNSGLASGTLYVTNSADPSATAWQIPFISGEVTVTLFPGNYSLQLRNQYGSLFDLPDCTVSAGQTLVITDRILIITTTRGGTTSLPAGRYAFGNGRVVIVQAFPSPYYTFYYCVLDGTDVGSTNPITVTMDTYHTLYAVFRTNVPVRANEGPFYGNGVEYWSVLFGDGRPVRLVVLNR